MNYFTTVVDLDDDKREVAWSRMNAIYQLEIIETINDEVHDVFDKTEFIESVLAAGSDSDLEYTEKEVRKYINDQH